MATANDILKIASQELGYSRWDDAEAGTKYGRWYAKKMNSSYFGTNGVPFCMMFVSWVFDKCGQYVQGLPAASCTIFYNSNKSSGDVLSNKKNAQPGDIVLYQWDGGNLDHVGIVEKNCGSYIQAIEGNTTGSDGRSGAVARRTRKWNAIAYIIRPPFSGSSSSGGESSGGTSKSYLEGIDISNWQKGIDLTKVSCDFVIAKATQGTDYLSPDYSRQVEQAISAGKLFGTYHYISGGDANAEADWYIKNVSKYVGKGILCLDWESNQNSAWGDESYLKKVAQRVIEKTGVRPLLYVQKSRMTQVQPIANELNCGLWIAQYANMDSTGYQEKPWNEGAYSCAIRQYSSAGKLSGWSGSLDLNKFYGSATAWGKYADPSGSTPAPTPEPEPETPSIDLGDTSWWGPIYTKELQRQLGTVVDGIVSKQPKSNKKYITCADTDSWKFVLVYFGGSPMVKALQTKIGVKSDGYFGKDTAKGLQRFLKNHGYNIGECGIDGVFGKDSCKALGEAIADQIFK